MLRERRWMDDDLFLLSLLQLSFLTFDRKDRHLWPAASVAALLSSPHAAQASCLSAYPQRTDRKPFRPPAGAIDHPPAATEDGDGDLSLMACRGAG